jgi:hypothetical protein
MRVFALSRKADLPGELYETAMKGVAERFAHHHELDTRGRHFELLTTERRL